MGKLDREELQGVIGHEMSHIRNLDIRFSLLVAVLVGSIALMSDFFLRATFWGGVRGSRRGSSRDGGGAVIVVYVIALVLAIIAPFVAALVQLAVSRQREYLADASSVELTRNPSGLERALAAIAGDQEALEVANRATQHLYFVESDQEVGKPLVRALLRPTHPSSIGSTGYGHYRRAATRPGNRGGPQRPRLTSYNDGARRAGRGRLAGARGRALCAMLVFALLIVGLVLTDGQQGAANAAPTVTSTPQPTLAPDPNAHDRTDSRPRTSANAYEARPWFSAPTAPPTATPTLAPTVAPTAASTPTPIPLP